MQQTVCLVSVLQLRPLARAQALAALCIVSGAHTVHAFVILFSALLSVGIDLSANRCLSSIDHRQCSSSATTETFVLYKVYCSLPAHSIELIEWHSGHMGLSSHLSVNQFIANDF